ncbi:prohead protease/major capsid protein fusion protein [Seohaeicola nanhaiensis]|uniref:Prohead protease/major capsid protein fusion protein n=1 Tax=Seohaeicola nanhaiensis TaxID=1387282 RepID=A0ABV9KIE4_9RHOB
MAKDMVDLPLIGREATVVADTIDTQARTIEVVWTTGATVQRYRWEGWDVVEYDEELEVSARAVRLERLNGGAPFLDSHRSWGLSSVIGSVVPDSVRISNGQGTAKIRLTDAEDAQPIVQRIMERTINKVSVGYRVHEYQITKKDGERDHYRAVDWEPYEISAVAMPADPGATIRSEGGMVNRFACVLTRQDITAAAAAIEKGTQMSDKNKPAAGQDPARTAPEGELQTREAPPTPATPPTAPDLDKVRSEERTRCSEITRLCARHNLDDAFREDLIGRGVSLAQARDAVLTKLEESDPMGRTQERAPAQARGDGATEIGYRDALANALMHRHNPGAVKLSDDGRNFRGMTMLEICRDALERRGVTTRGMSKMEIAGAAFQMRSAGYHSTSDFPSILANVANKTLRDAYASTQRTFMAWARRSNIVDFKPVNRVQLGGAPDLSKVLESGEFQYGTMGEGKETYALATYGKILGVTRQAIINDDLNAFTRVPEAFGASAADLESDIVYGVLIDNPNMADGVALFHATHGNLGTAAVINETSLSAAEKAFSKQKGLEGRLISVRPRFLIVPTGPRWVEARKQVAATTPNSTSDVNAYAGSYEVISEPRLLPASGQDPWFLAADPARIDTVEYAYLEGQEGVYTETRVGFEVDGMEIKARHDFAAKAIDWRGLYKNPGAAPA